MSSCFVCDALGIGFVLSEAEIEQVNLLFRNNQEYVSTEAAKAIHERTAKQPFTQEQFDKDETDSPFLKSFKFGASHDGYWNHQHMQLQFEDVVDCLKVLFPGHELVFLFDQSSGHTKKRKNGWSRLASNEPTVWRQTGLNARLTN